MYLRYTCEKKAAVLLEKTKLLIKRLRHTLSGRLTIATGKKAETLDLTACRSFYFKGSIAKISIC